MSSDYREETRFDAVVVGAGPAGTAAAYTLAKAGAKVGLIERGVYPGAKNVMGGILYRQPVDAVIPGFWKEAPLERHIIEQQYWTLSPESMTAVKHRDPRFGKEPYNRFSVLRAKFDAWFARQADEAGAYLLTKTVVEDLLIRGGRVVGVRTDRPDGELLADVVVLADGVNSLLAKKLGLRKKIDTEHVALAVKGIVSLPRETIESRFGLEKDEGAAIDIYGEMAPGQGAGFIYTNKDSLSVGLGVVLKDIVAHRARPYELLENMKNHPAVRPLLAGGKLLEYMAHLIPEGGYRAMPKLYGAGVLVVGDAAMMVNGFHREGSNLAMTSGKLAAETILWARDRNDFSEAALSRYERVLRESFVLKDLKKYKNLPGFTAARPHLFSVYPRMLNDSASEFITVDSMPKREKHRKIRREIVGARRSLFKVAADIIRGIRAFG